MNTACIIPARGGSKGIPRKNLANIIQEISLLEWTVSQALRCFEPAEVLVSTEDSEISEVAKRSGARVVPRPLELATDESSTASAVAHLLSTVDPDARYFERITILQVTSPLRRDVDVAQAKNLMSTQRFDSVVSGFELTDVHPAKMYFFDGDFAQPVCPDYQHLRRQALPAVFRRNGAIFSATRRHFNETGTLWGGRTGLVVMPKVRSVDIDTQHDLEVARNFLENDGAR